MVGSIVDLCQSRWQIEVFFKQNKQTLQLADFLGTSANAVKWQVWTSLLVYLLLNILYESNTHLAIWDGPLMIHDDALAGHVLKLRAEATGVDFSGQHSASVSFFVNGQPLKLTTQEGNTYASTNGFRENYLSFRSHSFFGDPLDVRFDQLRLRAHTCVRFEYLPKGPVFSCQ